MIRSKKIAYFLLVSLVFLFIIFATSVYLYTLYQKQISLPKHLLPKTIALTFDDGPVPETRGILLLLKEVDVKATFFVLGNEAEKHPDIIKEIATGGHVIGNHTYSHPHYIGLRSKDFIVNEIEETNTVLDTILGKKPKIFRPPFGETTFFSDSIIKQMGMQSFLWTLSTEDWKPEMTAVRLDAKFNTIKTSQIILMHDRIYGDIEKREVLRKNILRLKAEGYTFITL